MLQGILTAIVTPMFDNGEIDFISLKKLVENQISGGVSGLVVIGSTGESASLSHAEKLAVVQNVITENNSRVKIIVGVSQIATHEAQAWVEELNQIDGVDMLMLLTPAYVKPTQEGLYQHFKLLATKSVKPVILYNVPGRTACNLSDATILRLANDVPNIIGLKDATGDLARCCYLVKHKPKHFAIYSGDDATCLAFVLCGGNGVISVVSNVAPKIMSEMCHFALLGDKTEAILLNNQIMELHSLLFIEANPIPVKWLLCNHGIISSPMLRLPLTVLHANNQVIFKDFAISN